MDGGFIQDLFAEFGPVSVRRMFGGAGVFRDGRMFAIAIDGVLYLKADAESATRFRAAGTTPFGYARRDGRAVTTSYWRVPDAVLDDPSALAEWAHAAFAVAARARSPARHRRGKARGAA